MERKVRSTRSRFIHEVVKNKKAFDPRSFRTVPQGSHRITFGCPKGYYSPSTGRCKIPVEVQKILHPIEETPLWKNPLPCPLDNPVSERRILSEASRLYGKGAGRGTVSEYLSRKYRISPEEGEYYMRRAIRGGVKRSPKKKRKNSPVIVYDKILAIEAQKGKDSNFPGEHFRHDFKRDTAAQVIGLEDGSLLIKSTKGKRLWKEFDY